MRHVVVRVVDHAVYVGRATVASARASGHDVVAVVRLAGVTPDEWADDDGIEVPGGIERATLWETLAKRHKLEIP